jgi:hypothetical protein
MEVSMSKKSKRLLPKRIAGVKVPKKVRKGQVGEVLASKTGQALIAEAVMAVGALAAAKAKDSPKVRGALASAKDKVLKARDHAGHDVGATRATLTYALGEAVRSFSDALRDRSDGRAPSSRTAARVEAGAVDAKKHEPPLDITPA